LFWYGRLYGVVRRVGWGFVDLLWALQLWQLQCSMTQKSLLHFFPSLFFCGGTK
jgi:hypothetical protein